MAAYYNEIEEDAAEWMRRLIRKGVLPDGDVDTRSITEVSPDDLTGYDQCHFFAGIGTWAYSLKQAGWPEDRQVWTGSCPCQPFAAPGRKKGFEDERHLWPVWFRLIEEHDPDVIFGEQVASPDGLPWIDLVQSDLEEANYAFGVFDLCAAGFGSPHIRQRFFFVADKAESGVCDSVGARLERYTRNVPVRSGWPEEDRPASTDRRSYGCSGLELPVLFPPEEVNGFWRGADWVECEDDKLRPIKPGISPLAYGPAEHFLRVRSYGNGIVEPVAREFIQAYMELQRA
jgi:DNA (cytosine-5)-methyltransferase 1